MNLYKKPQILTDFKTQPSAQAGIKSSVNENELKANKNLNNNNNNNYEIQEDEIQELNETLIDFSKYKTTNENLLATYNSLSKGQKENSNSYSKNAVSVYNNDQINNINNNGNLRKSNIDYNKHLELNAINFVERKEIRSLKKNVMRTNTINPTNIIQAWHANHPNKNSKSSLNSNNNYKYTIENEKKRGNNSQNEKISSLINVGVYNRDIKEIEENEAFGFHSPNNANIPKSLVEFFHFSENLQKLNQISNSNKINTKNNNNNNSNNNNNNPKNTFNNNNANTINYNHINTNQIKNSNTRNNDNKTNNNSKSNSNNNNQNTNSTNNFNKNQRLLSAFPRKSSNKAFADSKNLFLKTLNSTKPNSNTVLNTFSAASRPLTSIPHTTTNNLLHTNFFSASKKFFFPATEKTRKKSSSKMAPAKLNNLKKLIDISPYANIPKSVKYSWVNLPGISERFAPRLQRSLKDSEGNNFKHISHGASTIFMKQQQLKEDFLRQLLCNKEEFSAAFVKAIRIKNIRRLISLKTRVVDTILDSRKAIKNLLDQIKSNFTVKTLDELISLLDLKSEKEFTVDTCYIFGENTNYEYTKETVKNFGIELARKKMNFREVIATLAFFRLDNYQAKITIMVNIFQKFEDTFIEADEITKVIKNCLFYQRDVRRITEILKQNLNNFMKNGKLQKNSFLDFLKESEEIQEIFQRNFTNTEDVDSFFDEEIGIICNNNLKKSKLTNFEDLNQCENMDRKLESVIGIIINCIEERKANDKIII